jgi:hypothetical protein
MVEWCEKRKLRINRTFVHRADDLQKFSTYKVLANARRRLEEGSSSAIGAANVLSLLPKHKYFISDWRVYGDASAKVGDCVFGCDAKLMGRWPDEMVDVARVLTSFGDFRYGIGYQRRFDRGPELYAGGISAGPIDVDEFEEAEAITRWADEASMPDGKQRHLRGHQRDVYPLNFLGAGHLRRRVAGLSLKTWIAKSRERGQLEKLTDKLWVWRVPASSLPRVRRALSAAGLLICA